MDARTTILGSVAIAFLLLASGCVEYDETIIEATEWQSNQVVSTAASFLNVYSVNPSGSTGL